MEQRYDIAVIGTGPAGLEAAITAKIRNKNIILFGSKKLTNKAGLVDHPIENYLGLPNVTGKEMIEAFQRHLDALDIKVTEKRVTSVFAMGDYYALQLSDNTVTEAKAVILAAGVTNGKPYPGEEEYVGRGVSYCATCDGNFYKGKDVCVIADAADEEGDVDFLSEIVHHVDYFPLYPVKRTFADNVTVHTEKVKGIAGDMKVKQLNTETGSCDTDGVFILREAQFPGQLVPGLDTENNAVKVNLNMETNLPGLFAAGDIAGQPYQYIKAAGQGNTAAISAVKYLASMK